MEQRGIAEGTFASVKNREFITDFLPALPRDFRQDIWMPNMIIRPGWHIPEKLATPESVYNNRRHFLKQMGFSGAGLMAGLFAGCSEQLAVSEEAKKTAAPNTSATNAVASNAKGYPYPRNPEFNPANLRVSNEEPAISYNNFYEFSTTKTRVRRLTGKFVISPWAVEIGGLVDTPMKLSVEEIGALFPLEERVYRFRCVEAWSMVVPWTGFPLSKLLQKAGAKPEAKFVKFTSFMRPDQAPGFTELANYPWPYTEGLRMDEAMNPLTLVVTGMYGKPLPKQNGAPIRMVIPWKYGYKGAKSIVKIELVNYQPKTLWETLAPDEYPFESNVNPKVPHPRWSQATERLVDTGNRANTQLYNGYGDYVAKLYSKT
jgi:sulfoxide reductase catalytic subunit YedY